MHNLDVCGDAGENKPVLPGVWKYSTCNYLQYIILDNNNEQLCYWLMHLLHYTCYCYFRVCSFYLY